MKKVLGCFGAGCVTVIVLMIVVGFWGYNWCSTTGKGIVVDAIDKIGVESAKLCLEPETASEVEKLSSELKQDFMSDKLSIVSTFKYCVMDNATATAKVYSEMLFGTMYRKLCGNIVGGDDPNLADSEGADTVRTVLYALVKDKLDPETASNMTKFLTDDKTNSEAKSESNGGLAGSPKTTAIKHGISKADMEKAVEALKNYVRDNNLETPEQDFEVDSTVKNALVSLINDIRTNCK